MALRIFNNLPVKLFTCKLDFRRWGLLDIFRKIFEGKGGTFTGK